MPDDERDPALSRRLEVEPLDDVTRRRLVSTALRETEETGAPEPARPSHAWRWLAAAAVIVLVLVGGLALLTAPGGHDEQQATGRISLTPKTGSTTDVGDFGDLDDPTNLAALRRALDSPPPAASQAAPEAAGDASAPSPTTTFGAGERSTATAPVSQCASVVPQGTVVARGTGTIDGRRATVVLIETADGRRSLDAVLGDPCELRHLG